MLAWLGLYCNPRPQGAHASACNCPRIPTCSCPLHPGTLLSPLTVTHAYICAPHTHKHAHVHTCKRAPRHMHKNAPLPNRSTPTIYLCRISAITPRTWACRSSWIKLESEGLRMQMPRRWAACLLLQFLLPSLMCLIEFFMLVIESFSLQLFMLLIGLAYLYASPVLFEALTVCFLALDARACTYV